MLNDTDRTTAVHTRATAMAFIYNTASWFVNYVFLDLLLCTHVVYVPNTQRGLDSTKVIRFKKY